MTLKQSICLGVLLVSGRVTAQRPGLSETERLQQALELTRADVQKVTAELDDLRGSIDQQREPLLEAHHTLSMQREKQRAKQAATERLLHTQARELPLLEREVEKLQTEHDQMRNALLEFRRVLETHAAAAQALELSSRLQALDDTFHGGPEQDLAEGAAPLLKIAETWNRSWQLGLRFEGVALDQHDVEVAGEFVVLGPASYFCSTDQQSAGPTITRPGSRMASVIPVSPASVQAIKTLLTDGKAVAPLDPTGGAALLEQSEQESVLTEIENGGPVMYPLLAIAGLALLLALLKSIQLMSIRVPRREAITEIAHCVRDNDMQQAAELTGRLAWPLPDLLRVGADHRHVAREHLEEILHEQVLMKLPALERHLGTLAVLGAIAPLLGLLGTVTGMIHTFDLVEVFGTGNADLLGGGISEALITTKFGLLIAVPVLLVHALLSRRVRRAIAALEHAALAFVNTLKVQEDRG